MRGLTRLLRGLLTVLFIVLLGLAGGVAWFHSAVDAPGPLKEARNVIIPAGDSSRMIADRLEQQGAIGGQTIFLAHLMAQNAIARISGAPVQQLKAGGRLAAVVGDEPVMRARLYKRTGDAAWSETDLFDTVAPRLEGFAEPTRFKF